MKIKSSEKRYQVQSLEKGLDILEIFGDVPPEKSLTEISQLTRFNLTTTHRIINALLARGYIRRNPSNLKFKLGFKSFELGENAKRNLSFLEEATPVLKSLADKTGETAYLMIIDNDQALYLERIEGFHQIKVIGLHTGGRIPLHVGAGPKMLLSSLPAEEIDRIIKKKGLPARTRFTITSPRALKKELKKIREQGYSISMEDFIENAAAVGCPIKNWEGKVVAAISIAGIINHFKGENLEKLIQITREAAEELSKRLNAHGSTIRNE